MNRKIPVEGHPNLVRDSKTGAILNINRNGIESARRAKDNRREDKDRIRRLEYELNELKTMFREYVQSKST